MKSNTEKEVAIVDVPTQNVMVMPNKYDQLIDVGFETNADLDEMLA